MTQGFDKDYWESHWQQADGPESGREIVSNPYLAHETGGLAPGTGLDAGCGEGAEALWLAAAGWQVSAADISTEVLARAAERAKTSGAAVGSVQWVEADLGAWEPGRQFDLVTTHYAHPAMPQLDFYQRISGWVAPGGTLLIVGHLHTDGAIGHGLGQGHDQQSQHDHDHDQGHSQPEGQDHGHDHDQGHSQPEGQDHGRYGRYGDYGDYGDYGHEHEHEPPEEASVTASSITAVLDATEWEVVTAQEPIRTLSNRSSRAVQLADVVVRATRRP